MQDEPRSGPGIPQVHEQVPGLLDDPGLDRVLRGAQDPEAPTAVLDHRKDTYTSVPLSRSAVKKSSARIPCAWDRSNSAHPGPSRRGAGSIPASLRICHTVDGATMMPTRQAHRGSAGTPMTRSPAPTGAPPTAQCGAPAAGQNVPGGTTAPTGRGQCRGASAKPWPGSRSAATRPGARPAASRRATPATPGPATSTANEPSAVHAEPPRADGAAGSQ
jgi:hypothetical protein